MRLDSKLKIYDPKIPFSMCRKLEIPIAMELESLIMRTWDYVELIAISDPEVENYVCAVFFSASLSDLEFSSSR